MTSVWYVADAAHKNCSHTCLGSVTVMKNLGQSSSLGNSTVPVTSSYSKQPRAHTSLAMCFCPAPCSAVGSLLDNSISGERIHSVPRCLQYAESKSDTCTCDSHGAAACITIPQYTSEDTYSDCTATLAYVAKRWPPLNGYCPHAQ